MRKLGIDPYLILLIDQWLTNRIFAVYHRNSNTQHHYQKNGIPQGSSISVLLWIIYIYDAPIETISSDVYVDDTTQWATGATKQEVLNKLKTDSTVLQEWCATNRINIQWQKTHLLFNEHTKEDRLIANGQRIKTTDTISYLGATLKANNENNNSTFTIELKEVAKDIRTRCKLMRGIRKYRIPNKTYQQICRGFIGGKLNYYLPWLAAEINKNMKDTLKPIETAYRDYMRTYTGCFPSTPIPLLHAISGFPLLKDRIITETTMTVLAAQANGTLLGKEYTEWNGEGDGWTPLGEVWKALKERIPESYEAIHSRTEIQHKHLKGCIRSNSTHPLGNVQSKNIEEANFYRQTPILRYGQMVAII